MNLVKNHTNPNLETEVFGYYCDRVLELCNHAFSPMYYRVFKRYWHDGKVMARMARNYCATDWENGVYEVYIPVRERLDGANMQYYRIVVKVVPEVDPWIARDEAKRLSENPLYPPLGVVDSELVAIVAPRRKARGFIRGFRHIQKRGYLTAVIISKVPEFTFKRLLTLITNFLKTRINKLLEKLHLENWQKDYVSEDRLYYIISNIIERFSYGIAVTLRSLSHSLSWLLAKLKTVFREIGLQNTVISALRTIRKLPESDQVRAVQLLVACIQGGSAGLSQRLWLGRVCS